MLQAILFENENNLLRCPNCDAPNLHQRACTVYSRREDNELVVRTSVIGTSTNTPKIETEIVKNEADNPSSRRDGLTILFDCELCPYFYELAIYQHKGATIMEWRLVEVETYEERRYEGIYNDNH